LEQHGVEQQRFGRYLRSIREQRKLSLDAVEEMSAGYPERITKSHLSRIENGQAIPTFPRMFALSQIYGVPVASLAEHFEVTLMQEMQPEGLREGEVAALREEALRLRRSGRYKEALQVYDALLQRGDGGQEISATEWVELALNRINCLSKLSRHLAAKEECEMLLGRRDLSPEHREHALQLFIIACYRLGRLTVARMAMQLSHEERAALDPEHELHASAASLEGNLMFSLSKFQEAFESFADSLERYERLGRPFEACRQRLNLGAVLIKLGRPTEAKERLTEAQEAAREGGYERLQAIAISNLGLLSFEGGDLAAAEARFIQSNGIARPREYYGLVFQNCFYLWKIAAARGDDASRRVNERSLRTYVTRVHEPSPEIEEYRQYLAGGGA
jgi:tetratricopeptide (TPR) repeat protein